MRGAFFKKGNYRSFLVNEMRECYNEAFKKNDTTTLPLAMKDIKNDYNEKLNKYDNVMLLLGKGHSVEKIAQFLSISIAEIELTREFRFIKFEEE
jgi:hypothetical protein